MQATGTWWPGESWDPFNLPRGVTSATFAPYIMEGLGRRERQMYIPMSLCSRNQQGGEQAGGRTQGQILGGEASAAREAGGEDRAGGCGGYGGRAGRAAPLICMCLLLAPHPPGWAQPNDLRLGLALLVCEVGGEGEGWA